MKPELHLFVLWEKARVVEDRILADMRNELDVVHTWEDSFRGDPAEAYKAFYSSGKFDGRTKVRKCGGGKFRVIVVRDKDPHYGQRWARDDKYYLANEKMYDLKKQYREWAGRRHRVHSTTSVREFIHDVFLLSGHTAEEWERGIPSDIGLNIPAKAEWRIAVESKASELGLENCRVMLENKYINDVFFKGRCKGRECIIKCSSKCPRSIVNEYHLAKRLYEIAPLVVAEPLAVSDGEKAFVVTAKVAGPSLAELLAKGITNEQADSFAADILQLAEALKASGIVHRDLFEDNLLLDSDGHLKAIDFQLAIDRNDYREDPWVNHNWKFHYVIFGVNRDLGLGVWNDFHALVHVLEKLPQTDNVKSAAEQLAAVASSMSFEARPGFMTRQKLRLYALSLRLQMLFRGKRHEKHVQLLRRYDTIRDGLRARMDRRMDDRNRFSRHSGNKEDE